MRVQGQTTRRKPRSRGLVVTLGIVAIVMLAAAGILWHGASERRKLEEMDWALHRVKVATEGAAVDVYRNLDRSASALGVFPDLQTIVDRGYLPDPKGNPYLDNGLSIISASDSCKPGSFSLFVIVDSDGDVDNVPVAYWSAPTWSEVAWTWAHRALTLGKTSRSQMYSIDWAEDTKPRLLWAGSDLPLYLSRGLCPADVQQILQHDYNEFNEDSFDPERTRVQIVDRSLP